VTPDKIRRNGGFEEAEVGTVNTSPWADPNGSTSLKGTAQSCCKPARSNRANGYLATTVWFSF